MKKNSTNSESQQLKLMFEECIQELLNQFNKLPWEDERVYATWLAQTYFFVRHVPPLIALSASRLGPRQRDFQYSQYKALNEELNHDLLLLNDLNSLNQSISSFMEFPETCAFYQCQYYYLEHESPLALLGASLSLEGLSAAGEQIRQRLQNRYGKKGTTFVAHHVMADQLHFKHSLAQIDQLDERDRNILYKNLLQSTKLYSYMLSAIERAYQPSARQSLKSAA